MDSVAESAAIVVGVATVVALVLLVLERRRQRESVDAAISVDAYTARRILRVWVTSSRKWLAAGPPRYATRRRREADLLETLTR